MFLSEVDIELLFILCFRWEEELARFLNCLQKSGLAIFCSEQVVRKLTHCQNAARENLNSSIIGSGRLDIVLAQSFSCYEV